jgi:TPR repeat protein
MTVARLGSLLIACMFGLQCSTVSVAAQETTSDEQLIVRSTGVSGIAPVAFDLNKESTQRFALILGNGDYDNVGDLPNAVADAKLLARTLRQSDYTVSEHYDLDKRGFEAVMREMLFEVEFGAEVLVFYAGHGVQVGGRNYILPTDSNVTSVYDLPFETVSLQSILALASSRARSVVAILDSCRENPFPDKELSVNLDGVPASVRNGFNTQESPINSLIVFSTSPGAVALDGVGDNSPFTEAMVAAIAARPDASFDDLLKEIRRNVYQRTGQRQLPWQSSSLIEPVYLARQESRSGWVVEKDEGAVTAGQAAVPITVTGTLNPKVRVGINLPSETGSPAGLTLLSHPSSGRIEVQRDGRLLEVPQNAALRSEDMANLYYRPASQVVRSDTGGTGSVRDTFDIGSRNGRQSVDVSLTVDPCDREAGDHLDPEGVGFAVYPNEIDLKTALAACEAAVSGNPQSGRFQYQLGRALLAKGDMDGAEAAYIKARDLGHTRAFQGLGLLEIARVEATKGRLSGRASERAINYFAAGVARGDPYAYHSLGLQLLRYPTSGAEQLRGFELLSRALELGHTFSMNALGLYFLDETGAHYDPKRGLRYLQGSAARDDIYGIANMGFVAVNGLAGERKDADLARTLFEQAAAGGHPTAPTSLGRLYVSGDLPGGADAAQAVKWYDEGLKRGDSWGGANAAWVIANRAPAGFALHDAAVRAAKSATLRNPQARKAALDVLAGLSASALDGGAQALMRDLGVDIQIDGAFGPQSREKLEEFLNVTGRSIPANRQDRLMVLAQIYWERSKFRVDLF